jgi:hypothetical protein
MRLFVALTATAAIATAAVTTIPALAQTGYALYTQWDDTTFDQNTCKQHGEQALRGAQFSEDITITENSVYGRHGGGYTAGVRCVSSKQMVFFVISGPSGNSASKYLDDIVKHF